MIDFSLPPEVEATRARIRDFVEQRLIPLEATPRASTSTRTSPPSC